MPIKHNAVRLETHCYLVASLALTLARDEDEERSIQRDCWEFGYVHDAGWLNLRAFTREGRTSFLHDDADPETIELLLELGRKCYPAMRRFRFRNSLSKLATFAKASASKQGLEQFPSASYVIRADQQATGIEAYGFVPEYMVFHTFSTSLNVPSRFRRIDLRRFAEHAIRIDRFRRSLRKIERTIGREILVPYEALIAESSEGIQYHLPRKEEKYLREEYDNWEKKRRISKRRIEAKLESGETVALTRGRDADCFICGRPGFYYRNIGRFVRFELDTWLSGPRTPYLVGGKNGVCDDCLTALINFRDLRGNAFVLLPIPRKEFITQKLIVGERLRLWMKLKDECRCHPEEKWLDAEEWRRTPMFSDVFMSFDVRHEGYERVMDIFKETVKTLEADRIAGIGAITNLDYSVLADRLSQMKTFAPISVSCINYREPEIISLNGFAFNRYIGIFALKAMHLKLQREISQSRNFDEMVAKILVRKGINTKDIESARDEKDFRRLKEAMTE